jgi:uncharacterized protein (DUF4415 family)
MKDEYDFSQGKQGAVIPLSANKTRITIRLDADVVHWFREQAHTAGGGSYQALINGVLREHIRAQNGVLEETLRKVIREELHTLSQ